MGKAKGARAYMYGDYNNPYLYTDRCFVEEANQCARYNDEAPSLEDRVDSRSILTHLGLYDVWNTSYDLSA